MIEERIARSGWTYQAVLPDGPDDFGWLHTIGLEDRGRAELIVVGLGPSTAQSILDTVLVGPLLGGGEWPSPGDTLPGPYPARYEVKMLKVDPDVAAAGSWFVFAHARRGRFGGLDALQVVWPSDDGSWPRETTTAQPLLGEPWW